MLIPGWAFACLLFIAFVIGAGTGEWWSYNYGNPLRRD